LLGCRSASVAAAEEVTVRVSKAAVTGVLCVCLVIGLSVLCAGCETGEAGGPPPDARDGHPGETSTAGGSPTTSALSTEGPSGVATTTTVAGVLVEFPQVFLDIAEALAPVRVYGWPEFPEGFAVAGAWWPVLECEDPQDYKGAPRANPWVGQDQVEPEAQLVLTAGEGWLVVLENFRGDLGDVAGRPVGKVGANAAVLYETNGGVLVQWSDTGRWYGVFGRAVASDLVIDGALRMQPVAIKDPKY